MITVEFDPRLTPPPVRGVDYQKRQDVSFSDDGGSIYIVDAEDLIEDPIEETAATDLLPPYDVIIVSQSSRMSDTGQIAIDVLVDVSDMPGAKEYELRMAVG